MPNTHRHGDNTGHFSSTLWFQLALHDPNYKVRSKWCGELLHIVFSRDLRDFNK